MYSWPFEDLAWSLQVSANSILENAASLIWSCIQAGAWCIAKEATLDI